MLLSFSPYKGENIAPNAFRVKFKIALITRGANVYWRSNEIEKYVGLQVESKIFRFDEWEHFRARFCNDGITMAILQKLSPLDYNSRKLRNSIIRRRIPTGWRQVRRNQIVKSSVVQRFMRYIFRKKNEWFWKKISQKLREVLWTMFYIFFPQFAKFSVWKKFAQKFWSNFSEIWSQESFVSKI